MRRAKKKSFDWYGTRQHFSIRKYHFGAASVLLGMSLAVGTGTAVQAEDSLTTSSSAEATIASTVETQTQSTVDSTPIEKSSEESISTETSESSSELSLSEKVETDMSTTSTENLASPTERSVQINYIIQYVLEDGTLVKAVVQNITTSTTETVASSSIEANLELPDGYEFAPGQAASVSHKVTEGAENIVTVKVVKKEVVATSTNTTTEVSTTADNVADTPATSTSIVEETVKTPVTVEEAKVVLEQVTSEAEVLANESERLVAASDKENTALKAAAAATKLTATEATAVLNDSTATLESVNAQIDAVRTNVEALALELRKFLGTDLIQVALTTTTTMENGNGVPGTWVEDDTVLNKEEASASATLSPSSQDFPAGYVGDPNTNRTTFMIYSLSGLQDSTVQPGTTDGSFNMRRGTDLYMVLSTNRSSTDGDFIYLNLYDKKTGQIALDDNGNKIQEELAVAVGQNKELTGLNAFAKKSTLTDKFKYTLSLTETVFKNAAGESKVLRNMQLKSGMGGKALNTLVYHNQTASRGDYNDYSGTAPTYTPRQVTSYFVKATDLRDEEFLASYTQSGDLSGDNFTIAGEGIFDNYELIESPAVTSGTLASDYVAGTSLIRWYGGSLQSKVQYITKDDGSARYLQFLVNPDHPDFLETYAKYKNMPETDFQAEGETAFRLLERIAIVEKVEKDIAAVNADTTLSDEEKTAKIQTIRAEATAKINTADDKFFLTYSGENLDPLDYNDTADVVTGLDEWNYTSTKYKFSANNVTSDTLSSKVGDYQGYPKAIWNNVNTGILTILDKDGKPVVNPYTNTKMEFKGHQLSMFNSNGANFNNQKYYYAEKGGVKVYYVDTEGNVLQDSKSIYDHEATNTAYDTKSVKDEKITAADGTVYYYKEIDTTGLNPASSNTDTEKRTIEKITEEVGTVAQDTLKELTYVYEKAGSVNVNYVDTDGKPLQDPIADVTNGQPGSNYDTVVDNKPTTITTADGKTYQLVPAGTYNVGTVGEGNNLTTVGNGIATGIDGTTGTVESGVTKEITYVYQEVKGDVIVHYVDQDGNPISGTTDAGTTTASTVTDTPESSTGTPYDTKDLKPNTITTTDGKVYRLVPAATKGNETGEVVVGTTSITYVYEEVKGDVVVEYYDTEGNLISGLSDKGEAVDTKEVDTPSTSTGTAYNTDEDHKPTTITTADGTVYYYKEVKDTSASTTGEVVEGTTTVQYVYEKAGSVNVNYVDTDGKPLLDPVADVTDGKPGSDYDTLVDNKHETIATADGKLYRLVPAGTYKVGTVSDDNNLTAVGNGTATGVDSVTGTVEAGTTKEITYVYEEVKGDVKVEYYDTDGNVIATTVVDTPTSSTGTPYNTLDKKPATITAADGTVYYYKEVKSTSAAEDGTVVEGTTTVQYVYEKAGSVNVNYVDTEGKVISPKVADETNEKAGTEYSTTDNKPSTITTEDGKTYRLVEAGTYNVGTVSDDNNLTSVGNGTATGVDSTTGTVEAGTTKEITYVYEEVKGNVVVNYITTDGTVIKQPVEDTPSTSTGTPYNTTDSKPTTITTEDGKTYRIVPTLTKGNETGDVVEGTTSITYVYEEVKGDVVVEYYDTEGNLISGLSDKGEAVDTKEVDTPSTSTGTAYNTDEDHKPNTITTADGTVYYYKEVKDTSASTTGEVVEGTTTVQYVYEKAGNVIVHYITEDGKEIKATVTDEENAEPGKSYTTTDNKPTTITTADGTVYELIPTATIGNEDGSVEAGKTIEVTYVYRKVETPNPAAKTGNVVVEYYNTAGEKIASDVVDTPETTTGTVYETFDFKPATITKDGVTYFYKEVKDTSAAEKGTVVEGTTTVQYVYEPAGSVTVNYVTTDGTVIKSPVKDEENAEPGKTYSTEDNKPETITTEDGKTYKLVPNATTGEENGTITSGEDKQVTYVYEEVKGDVVVNYIDTEGNVIKAPVTDTPSTSTGTAYDTTDNKPETITTEDGTEYKLVPVLTKGEENGSVVEGTTQVTYVYQKVTPAAKTGNVVVEYYNTAGEKIASDVVDTPETTTGTVYETLDFKPASITKDGVTYFYKEVKDTSAAEKGTVVEGTTTVQYVYEPAGSVTVNYVTTDGIVIKSPVKDEENAEPGKTYSTEDNKPETITTEDGKTYKLVPNATTGEENGTVTSGEDKQITYVYEEVKGNVVVNYVDTEGNVIKAPVTDTASTSTGTAYDTTDNKPETITTEDGTEYKLVPVLTKGEENGSVVEGTTQVTYVYQKVTTPAPKPNGSVVVNYVNTNGETIATSVNDTTDAALDTTYDTTDYKPAVIKHNGVTYFYKEVKTGDNETGKVIEGTTEVTYIYEPAGSVTVNYVTTDGTVIKTPVKDEENAEPGKTYTTEDNKPTTITTEDGKTYHIVPKLTTGEENGTITSGEDKQVTYVYEEVTGDVVVNYIDTEGNVIKAPVTDTPVSSTGTSYDTTDNKPTSITTEDGSVYELIPVLTKGEESGKVVAGTTQVTYIYRKVSSPAPVVQTGNVVVEYYNTAGVKIAEDVVDTPETTTGTSYDTTEFKPSTITKDGVKYFYKEVKDTSASETGTVVEGTTTVQYVYEPAGSVTVNYVTTDGTVIKTPVKDEENAEPGKTYSTEEQKTAVITTEDGKTYQVVPKLTTGEENGTITSGEDKQVTYVYEEVTGDVVVNYIDTEGNVIKAPVTDTDLTSTGTTYDTTDNKPTTITTEDGSVYELVPVLTKGEESGKVVAGTTQVTYVYRKVSSPTPVVQTGNVVVEYYNTAGEKIAKDVVDTPETTIGTVYETLDYKPTTITKDGIIYFYKEVKDTSAAEKGRVVEGTTIVQYVYEPAGSVTVNYVTTDGSVIKPSVKDEVNAEPGKTYSTEDQKPTVITTEDGKTYHIVPKLTAGEENGTITSGEDKQVTYVYEEVTGDVVVNYIDTEGNVIKAPVTDTPVSSTGTNYDTTDHKPTTITTEDGSVYELLPVLTKGEESGKVVAGTTQITYVYRKISSPTPVTKQGTVVVHYVTEDGTVIASPVTDTPASEVGTSYDTRDNKPTTITTEDGTTYELVPVLTKGSETGKVVEGETVVTYVYRKVVAPTPDVKTGSVVIRYVEAGNESNVLKDPVLDENAVVTGTKYDTTDEGDKPAEIVKDGVRYVLVPSKTTAVDPNGNPVTETGEVAEGTTVVTYKYQKVANWIPQIPVTPENPTPVNPVIPYPFDPTNPDKPIEPTTPYPGGEVPSIPHVPGFTPVDPKTNEPLKPVDPTDPSKGYVPPTPDESGIDTPIPYVQNGNVVVNYVDENGNVIKAPVQDETDAPAGKSYDTTDNKPAEIVTEDGSRYVLIPSKTVGSETGTVEGGKTTEITYVYKKVANWIPQIPATPENPTPVNPVIPYPFDPTNPDKPIEPTTPYPGGEVPSIPHVPGFTPVDPKTNEPLKPVDPTDPSKGYVPPTPDESGIDTPIPYVQNGNVVVNYVTEDGTPIKKPVKDETNAPAGKSYDTTDNKPAEIVTEDGSRYVLIPSKTVGSETGTVEGGKTTEVTYVYR
ncbi:TPA: MucBP domain-containing protein, partial [Streptococcus suis]|nr:MucBP domain-containing protein [Streptococcus suis]